MTDSHVNLAARRLGAGVLAASDEFFGEKENLLRPEPPAVRPRTFGHKGQIVDGWESRRRGHGLDDVVRWMAAGPAALAGLPGKGAIAPRRDADLVAFDDEASFIVDPARLRHRHPVTPYAGQTLTGVVRRTWLRGRVTGGTPAGRLLSRT